MKRTVAVSLVAATVAALGVSAQISLGASEDTECWDQYNLRGTKFLGTVAPDDLSPSDCTPGEGCYFEYRTDNTKRRLLVPHGADPKTACIDPPVTTSASTTTATTAPPADDSQDGSVTGSPTGDAGERFTTLAVGAALPSDEDCAAAVRPMSENRSANAEANATKGTKPNARYPRVTGAFTGTTDEILQWTACKWGIDEDIVRAQIVAESFWNQSILGDFTTNPDWCSPAHPIGTYDPQYPGDPEHVGECPESVGLGQVRYEYHKEAFEDLNAVKSSAYNLDYVYAVWRSCFEGEMTWLNQFEGRKNYAAGDSEGCLGVWFTGRWRTAAAEDYIARVTQHVADRTWANDWYPAAEPVAAGTSTTSSSTTSTSTTSTTAATTTAAPTTAAPTTAAPTTAAPTSTSTSTSTSELLPVYQPIDGCSEGDIVPLGQGSGATNFEPLGSIWCFDLGEPPARTAVEGSNSWVDDFTVGCPTLGSGCTSMFTLDDRQMGYRVFDGAGESPGRSQHWINQNHWMVDAKGGFTGGTSMRPDRSFEFQNGKFVVEGDFAASIPEYDDDTWGEITITSAPAPTGVFADSLYAYGQFGGHWAVGCRLQGSRYPVCAVMAPSGADSPDTERCFALGYRVIEMSGFQRCGSDVMGGGPWGELAKAWRTCQPDGPDMACRDRFRMEVTKSSLTLYVNGVKYFEDANWPAAHQLPDSFVNGDVYAYQSNWQHRTGTQAYRYHWDHFAVNPPTGPTAGEWYR